MKNFWLNRKLPPNKFKIGDIVFLDINPNLLMTVSSVTSKEVECIWFNSSIVLCRATFPPDNLIKI